MAQKCPAASAEQPISSAPCLDASGRLPLPLQWGDRPARQVPLWIRWEDYAPRYLRAGVRALSFVQLGAHCGKNTYNCAQGGDPLWSYVTMCGWRGVAIEPSTPAFTALCRNYARWPAVRPLRAAVSNESDPNGVLMRGGAETNQLVFADAQPSAKGRYIAGRARAMNESVPVLTLAEVWTAAPKPVDVLALDVEGAEPRILTGISALAPAELPSMILYEHLHLSAQDRVQVHSALLAVGFHWVADLLYVDKVHLNVSTCRCAANRHLKTCPCPNRPANRLYGRPRRGRKAEKQAPLVVSVRSGTSYVATQL